jgi:hypothetical protein
MNCEETGPIENKDVDETNNQTDVGVLTSPSARSTLAREFSSGVVVVHDQLLHRKST